MKSVQPLLILSKFNDTMMKIYVHSPIQYLGEESYDFTGCSTDKAYIQFCIASVL